MGLFSKLFKPKEKSLPNDVRQAFDRMLKILNTDDMQNQLFLSPALKNKILAGHPCDQVPNPKGGFGYSTQNPIPVNGAVGELTYLSRLQREKSKQHIIFHRLGSGNVGGGIAVDIYEVASLDGGYWGLLMFDMYHPVKSKQTPEGYIFADRVEGFTGTNKYLDKFPSGILEATRETATSLMIPVVNPVVAKNINLVKLVRPSEHAAIVQGIRQELERLKA